MEYLMSAIFRGYFEAIKPLVGLVSLVVSPFSIAFGLFSVIAFLAVRRLVTSGHAATAVISAAAASLWVSLFLSTRPLRWPGEVNLLNDPMEAGGFPLLSLLYPYPPMGGDVPPLAQWPPFFLNYFFWLAVSILIVPRAARALRRGAVPIGGLLAVIGVLVTLYGLGDTLIRFD